MAVMFNVLQRGKWKNLSSANISKQYTYRTTTPTDDSPRPFQQITRNASEGIGTYVYRRSIEKPNLICFGRDGIKQYDFYDYAYLPSNEKQNNYQARKPKSSTSNAPILYEYMSYAKYENRNGIIEGNLIYRSTEDLPFSDFGFKTTRHGGIFYSFVDEACKVKDCNWFPLSVADKDALPTIKCFNKSNNIQKAGKIFTKNILFTSSTSSRNIYVYPNKVVDGNNEYYFDENDINTKVRCCYMVLQSPGGNGGCSRHWAVWHGYWIFGYWTYHWASGAGGGAGGYSVELIKIPQDGYLKINIPGAPQRAWNRGSQPRANSIKVYDNNDSLLSEVVGGQAGEWASDTGTRSGGYGGYTVNTLNSNNRVCLLSVTGAQGANSNKGNAGHANLEETLTSEKTAIEQLSIYFKNNAEVINNSEILKRLEQLMKLASSAANNRSASSLPQNSDSFSFKGLLSTDDEITLPSIKGKNWSWDSFDDSNIPGAGAPSTFAQGGSCGPLQSGSDGEGYGAGAGGGAKAMFDEYIGGAGGGALVCIGY